MSDRGVDVLGREPLGASVWHSKSFSDGPKLLPFPLYSLDLPRVTYWHNRLEIGILSVHKTSEQAIFE